VQGIFESEINKRLKEFSARLENVDLGYLPQCGENWVTLFTAADTEEEANRRVKEAEEQIIPLLGVENVSGGNDEPLEKVIGERLRERGLTLATAESCTGGLIARRITAVPGASDYLDRAFVTYSNRAKEELLKVPGEMIEANGAVSEPVALAMARGTRTESGTDVAVAITGIAGPSGGSPEKPVGTVFIACATGRGCVAEKHLFSGTREQIQESAAQAALVLLWRTLSDDPDIHCS
jgi:nicotinamide-nucleotide amidase